MQYVQGSRSRLPFLFLRKLAIVFLIVVTLISSTFLPRADAIAPAIIVPAAVGTFVGVVAIGAVALDLFGYTQQSDETMAFAQGIWITASDKVKQSVMDSYNAAVAAGNKTMALSDDVVFWLQANMADAITVAYGEKLQVDNAWLKSGLVGLGMSVTYGKSATFTLSPSGYQDGKWVDGKFATAYGKATSIVLKFDGGSRGFATFYLPTTNISVSVNGMASSVFGSYAATEAITKGQVGSYVGLPSVILDGVYNDLANRKGDIGDSIPRSIPVPTTGDFVFGPGKSTDIPARDYATPDVVQQGTQLVDDAGKVYAPDMVQVKAVPKPQVVKDAVTGADVPAVPVGAVRDKTGDITKTGDLVNVRTGDIVKTGDTTANPPFDTTIGTINWGPITGLPAAFTTTFPFSLPWDVKRLIDLLVASPQQPKIQAKFYGEDMIITLPRLVTDNILLIRSGILISVVLGLVLLTRKLLGGAQ